MYSREENKAGGNDKKNGKRNQNFQTAGRKERSKSGFMPHTHTKTPFRNIKDPKKNTIDYSKFPLFCQAAGEFLTKKPNYRKTEFVTKRSGDIRKRKQTVILHSLAPFSL